jgi:hypothetical protein
MKRRIVDSSLQSTKRRNVFRHSDEIVLNDTFIPPLRNIVSEYLGVKQMERDLSAVTQYGMYLQYVKNRTPEIFLAAVTQNGYAIEFVENQTEEICLAAVTQNGWSLKWVTNQTREICLAAVTQEGWALAYVKNQTEDICLAAVTQNGDSISYVKNRGLRRRVDRSRETSLYDTIRNVGTWIQTRLYYL